MFWITAGDSARCSRAVVASFGRPIATPFGSDSLVRPASGLDHSAAVNQVVGTTG